MLHDAFHGSERGREAQRARHYRGAVALTVRRQHRWTQGDGIVANVPQDGGRRPRLGGAVCLRDSRGRRREAHLRVG